MIDLDLDTPEKRDRLLWGGLYKLLYFEWDVLKFPVF